MAEHPIYPLIRRRMQESHSSSVILTAAILAGAMQCERLKTELTDENIVAAALDNLRGAVERELQAIRFAQGTR